MGKEVSQENVTKFRKVFNDGNRNAVVQRAATKNGVLNASEDIAAKVRLDRTFSIEIDTGKVTNQLHSGRCWLFSLLNTLRHQFADKHDVKDFELSQAYSYFWDKVERANIFYENIIRTADKPANDREVEFYLAGPGDDGGQWAMAAGLVQKYGVVPSSVMPETFNTNDTTGFASALDLKLRKDAIELRELVANGASEGQLNAKRDQLLGEVYRMTAIAVGEPPVKFDFEYRDDKKKYHRDADLTPKAFYDKYIGVDLDDYVVVTNAPYQPFNKLYSLPAEDNIVGGKKITLLNVEMDVLRKAAIAQLKDGETVWFGNDVLEQMDRKDGLLDSKLYQTDALFDVDLSLSKAERFLYGQAQVSHAMTFTGVDVVDDKATKWKVENSWGDKNGDKGYFAMTDDWFENYVYEVVVHRKYLTADQLKIADSKPEPLPVWDPLM
ncbi:C1 family peptidase [Pediococcus ethanolidurans]|uniref:C1 family peptidase n=1 Tax=Pediococcus ethanolidurans TaxID=319653 RepID=UPI0021A9DD3C|nr:C1 family peptidase [Pediococcus ethanolidurans]MCT4397917.1 aminopeptidase [Pediococcus ethanolidurans]MCV3320911.1 C1 family peptidase [Pediococcus ethanolidurans]MCV3323628.1 C1 family peptidase [Pediococcus ethanolidurans]MCV3327355.1 C1 family peptidase [Pediococcus ethanolidurans]MCV3554478.1 C1 family peptidase [Pediococcus ethanolidurans]